MATFSHLVEDDTYYFDAEAWRRVVDFVERFCKLSDPMGEPFILLPWQKQIVMDVFGWKRRDNDERRFISVYIEVPRKQGKTFFVAALLLYLLMAEGQNAEVYAAACTNEQSGRVFKSVKQMISQSKWFEERLDILAYRSEVVYEKGGSILKALSGESVGSHGKYPSAVVCDEVHEWTNPKAEMLYEALTSGFGNRKSPLVLHITTAGFGSEPTLAKRLHDKAIVFEKGECTDPSFYGVVYAASIDDDWTSEETWKKANPSWELAEKNLKREFPKAKTEASEEVKFKRLYLNLWTAQRVSRWIDMTKYDAATKRLKYEDYKGKTCILGIDLAQIYDLTAVSILYPNEEGHLDMFVRCYSPQQTITKRTKDDAIPYATWAKDGWLIPTYGISKGTTIDYETIAKDIEQIAKENVVAKVGYDPAGAQMIVPQLENVGLDCIPIYQSFNEMSPASKEFERRLTSGEVTVQENPCLRWQMGNVEVEHKGELIKPSKPNNKGSYGGTAKYKVDGVTASVIAIQTCLLTFGKTEPKANRKPLVFFVGNS